MKISTSGPLFDESPASSQHYSPSSQPQLKLNPMHSLTTTPSPPRKKTSVFTFGIGEEDMLPPTDSLSPEEFRQLSELFGQQCLEREERRQKRRSSRRLALVRQKGHYCEDEQEAPQPQEVFDKTSPNPSSQLPRQNCHKSSSVSVAYNSNVKPQRLGQPHFSSEINRSLPKGHFESPLSGSINQPNSVKKKSSNRRVQFGNVVLFKFGLAQGVDTVPTAGSISLGMEQKHHSKHTFRLDEYAIYKNVEDRNKYSNWRTVSKAMLAVWAKRQKQQLKEAKKGINLANEKQTPNKKQQEELSPTNKRKCSDKAIETEESVKMDTDCEKKQQRETSSDEEEVHQEDEEEQRQFFEHCRVFEPLRRAILHFQGVTINEDVAKETLKVAESRSQCGCQCRGGCKPNTCECAKAGIKCQVDINDEYDTKNSYPCKCTARGCKNPEGRIELDAIRIRNHFLQTLMRIEAAKRKGLDWSDQKNSPQHIIFSEDGTESKAMEMGSQQSMKSKLGMAISSNVQLRPQIAQINCTPSSSNKIQSPDPFVTLRKKRPIPIEPILQPSEDGVKRSIEVQEDPPPTPDPTPFPNSPSLLYGTPTGTKNSRKKVGNSNAYGNESPSTPKRQKRHS